MSDVIAAAVKLLWAIVKWLLHRLRRVFEAQQNFRKKRIGSERRNPKLHGNPLRSRRSRPLSEEAEDILNMRWRAARQLLSWLTFPRRPPIPLHLRHLVEQERDVVRAVVALIRELGCDAEKVRARSSVERELFVRRLEDLSRLSECLNEAPEEVRVLIAQLIHDAAWTEALRRSGIWRALYDADASCAALEQLLERPSGAPLRGVQRRIASAIGRFADVQEQEAHGLLRAARGLCEAFIVRGELERLQAQWAESGASQRPPIQERMRLVDVAADVLARLFGDEDLNPVNLTDLVRALSETIRKLKNLVARGSLEELLHALGLSPGQAHSPETIRRAYHLRARQLHPDHNPHDPNAASKFQALKDAYDELMSRLELA